MGVGLEAQVTEMVQANVAGLVAKFKAGEGGEEAWAHKDTAVYLMSAVAARGSTLQVCHLFINDQVLTCRQHGVTSTNIHVDVVQFFLEHVAGDLQAPAGSVHPILQVDAIRFVHMFRNQVRSRRYLYAWTNHSAVYERTTFAGFEVASATSLVGQLCLLSICGYCDRTDIIHQVRGQVGVSLK